MLELKTVTKPADLAPYIPQWEALAREASEDNPFYEHWMLIPALECLDEGAGVEVVLVFDDKTLIGLFPLQKMNRFRGLPLPHYRLWSHRHCYLSSPLIRRGREREALGAVFDWLKKRLLAWNWASGEGAIFSAFEALARERGWVVRETGYERAVLRGKIAGEDYVNATISGKHRRDYARLEKRMAEAGELAYRVAGDETEALAWLERFFELEASGWKGREGTAMKCNPGDRDFMSRIVRSAFALGKARLSSLSVGSSVFATKCEFVANRSCFGFKVGFDERHAKSRPGLLLEVWLLKQMGTLDCDFFDSCSQPGSMFERIWAHRRRILTLSVATRAFPEGMLLKAIPHAKRALEKLRSLKSRPPAPEGEGAATEDPA